MAKVNVQVAGGSIQLKNADTIRGLQCEVGAQGYQSQVNGEPVDQDYRLTDYEFVTFAKPVKAG